MKVCHLTSVHPRSDVRIYKKECTSLISAGYNVLLVVADDLPDEDQDGVAVISVGKKSNRFIRMLVSVFQICRAAVKQNADVYHFHDPELIPLGIWLKFKNKMVICDVHEDVPGDILNKPYLPGVLKKFVAWCVKALQFMTYRFFDVVIAATPAIRDILVRYNPETITINNYPILDEFRPVSDWQSKKKELCYIGLITRERGITELVDAIGLTDFRLNLAGTFYPDSLLRELEQKKAWKKINFYGQISRTEVAEILNRSCAGIVTFHPAPNHSDAQPNKMFEYMSAGIPVIASDFTRWKDFVEQNACGVCVDPLDPDQIAQAINLLVNDRAQAEQMGRNGYRAVKEKYSWNNESMKLLGIYRDLIKKKQEKYTFGNSQ